MTVFFYGLFMDSGLLDRQGVRASDPKIARLEGYRLSIGSRATLVRAPGETVYGVVMRVSPNDLERLYSGSGLGDYRAEMVQVILGDGQKLEAICYNLPPSLDLSEPNRAYAARLYEPARRLGLPDDYVAKIAAAGSGHGA